MAPGGDRGVTKEHQKSDRVVRSLDAIGIGFKS